MVKKIFQCSGCGYFPSQIEINKYFISSDTFQCPSCDEISSFDKSLSILINSSHHLLKLQNQSSHPSSIHLPHHASNEFSAEPSQSIRNTVLICMEKGSWIFQPLYLNPINPELKNSFNLSKHQILRENKMVFFCTHDEIFRKLTKLQRKPSEFKSLKYQSRKILKIQHFLYSIDLYLQNIHQSFFNNSSFDIVVQMISRKTKASKSDDTSKVFPFDYQTQAFLKFNIDTYNQFQSFLLKSRQSQNGSKLESTKNIQLEEFDKNMRDFLEYFYSFDEIKDQQKTMKIMQSQRVQNKNIKAFALFCNRFELSTMKNIIESKTEEIQAHQRHNPLKNFPTHCFYFQNQQARTIRQSPNYNHLIQSYQLNDISVSHSFLYIPQCKSKADSDFIIKQTLEQSFQNLKNIQNITYRSITQKNNPKSQYDQKTTLKVQDQNSSQIKRSLNEDSAQYHSFEPSIFIFWTQKENSQNKSGIKLSKMKLKSVENTKMKFFNDISKGITKFQQSMLQSFEQQVIDLLSFNLENNVCTQNAKVDRVYAEYENHSFYYIFNYDQIVRQNYEELDFLDQHYLPNELKGFSTTYQRAMPNPFKKGIHRVSMKIQNTEEPQLIENQFSDDDMQSL